MWQRLNGSFPRDFMSYSRTIHGARDARVLAELFRRIGAELRRAGFGVVSVGLAEVKPDGEGETELKQGSPFTTPGRVCGSVPSRTTLRPIFLA